MRKRSICAMFVALLLFGCGEAVPTTSGGKTAGVWADMLQKSDVEMRRKAAMKLGPLLQLDPVAIPALVGALKDTDPTVRLNAARSLGIYSGPKAPEVLPALRELRQKEVDAKVRDAAAKAIASLEKGKDD
jgi:HEAT repeat protein